MSREFIHRIKEDKIIANFGVVILAAGVGERLGGGSKPLIPIDNETLLGRQIRLLRKKYGDNLDISVVVGHKANEVITRHYGQCRFVLNQKYEETNVVGSLYLGLINNVKPSVLVVYGDLVFDFDALPAINDQPFLLTDASKQMNSDEVGVLTSPEGIHSLSYNHKEKWCQIGYFNRAHLSALIKYSKITGHHKHLGFEAINSAISEVGPMSMIRCGGKIVEIDALKDIEIAQKRFVK